MQRHSPNPAFVADARCALRRFAVPRLRLSALRAHRLRSSNVSEGPFTRDVPLPFNRLGRSGPGQPVPVPAAVRSSEEEGFSLLPSAYLNPAAASPGARRYRTAARQKGRGGLIRRGAARGGCVPAGSLGHGERPQDGGPRSLGSRNFWFEVFWKGKGGGCLCPAPGPPQECGGPRGSRGAGGSQWGPARPCDRRGGRCPCRAGSRHSAPRRPAASSAAAGLTHASILLFPRQALAHASPRRGRPAGGAERGAPRQTKQRWQGSSPGSGTSGSGCRTTSPGRTCRARRKPPSRRRRTSTSPSPWPSASS